MGDRLVVTRESKQAAFDKDWQTILTDGEGDYFLICLSPSSRWLLITLLEFYGEFHNRFLNYSGEREIDQLRSETLEGLICPMACSEDFQALVAEMVTLNATMVEVRDRLGDTDGDLDARLTELVTEVDQLGTIVAGLDTSDLYDQVEEILNGVGVILGADEIPVLP